MLHDGSHGGVARLEYYDSDKKFRSGQPKRSVELSSCFNINNKFDAKCHFAIALYTKEDCFGIVCDNEAEQHEWLSALVELSRNDASTVQQPFFGNYFVYTPAITYCLIEENLYIYIYISSEHIWQVTLKEKGLGKSRDLTPGNYRLCLTNRTLGLIKMNKVEPSIELKVIW